MCPTVYPEHDAWELIGLAWRDSEKENKQENRLRKKSKMGKG